MKANEYISALKLKAHPEGGYYREVYRSYETIEKECLASRYSGSRSASTSIYFMLTKNEISHFHRITSDEIWHHYDGGCIHIYVINNQGKLEVRKIGKNLNKGESLQVVIENGQWFAARVEEGREFGLVGCTVAPGFDFADFELAEKQDLITAFPNHETIISEFTK